MIYVSANGEVLGQFEEVDVPAMLADGRVPKRAFYWREGMPEWRPVAELPAPAKPATQAQPIAPKPMAPTQTAPAAIAEKLVLPGRAAAAGPVAARPAQSSPPTGVTKTVPAFQPRRPVTAAPTEPRPGPKLEPKLEVAPRQTSSGADLSAPAGKPAKKGRPWLVLASVLLLLSAAGAGAWWWLNREPAPIAGRIALLGDESGPVEIRVFRRAELVAPWRDRLVAAEARQVELDELLAAAQAELREKSLLHDEAARVCEVGEEYNMPDVAELRAARDAKKVEADAAKAELDKLQAEKDGLFALESLLQSVPAPQTTLVADSAGNFALPPPEEGEVVLLATAFSETDGRRESRGWLEIVEMPADGSPPDAVELSESNRLDLSAIRRFAGGDASQ